VEQQKTLTIVNPVAGGGKTAGLWPQIKARLEGMGLVFDWVVTESPGHAVRLSADALRNGYTLLISVGGDGTLHEVVNGLMQVYPQGTNDITVAVVPVGTGADFVRTLGIPRTWQTACAHLAGDKSRTIDVGEMTYAGTHGEEHRYFVNVAGLGFDGEVTARSAVSSKRLGGTIPYLSSLVLTLIDYANKDVEVHMDDQHLPGRMNSVVVANGGWFGGGMYIAPNARPDDGMFDVVMIGDVGKLELLQTVPRVYSGTHLTHPKVKVVRAREVRVDSQQPMWLQADGEALGQAPVTFSVRSQALRLKV
jgi:diacylglycerol kinase (ATP)